MVAIKFYIRRFLILLLLFLKVNHVTSQNLVIDFNNQANYKFTLIKCKSDTNNVDILNIISIKPIWDTLSNTYITPLISICLYKENLQNNLQKETLTITNATIDNLVLNNLETLKEGLRLNITNFSTFKKNKYNNLDTLIVIDMYKNETYYCNVKMQFYNILNFYQETPIQTSNNVLNIYSTIVKPKFQKIVTHNSKNIIDSIAYEPRIENKKLQLSNKIFLINYNTKKYYYTFLRTSSTNSIDLNEVALLYYKPFVGIIGFKKNEVLYVEKTKPKIEKGKITGEVITKIKVVKILNYLPVNL